MSRTAAQNREMYLRNRASVLERSRRNYQKNRELRTEQIKAWANANPENRKAIQKRYTVKNPDKRRALWVSWYMRNKEAYNLKRSKENRLKYPARKQAQQRWWIRYYKANKDRLSIRVKKRNALKKKASINLSGMLSFVTRVRSSTSVTCYYCSATLSGRDAHFDHIIPLVMGGEHSVKNLCVSCPKCNLSKGRKTPQMWIKCGQQLLSL